MSNFVRDKRIITQTVLKEIPPDGVGRDVDSSMLFWWTNIRSDGGLRLTDIGDQSFKLAGLESWDYTIEKSEVKIVVSMSGVLNLDHSMPCPYYLAYNRQEKTYKLRIYDSRVAMMIQLSGSITGYLRGLKRQTK
jgi:hypothetical protein